MKLKMTRRPKNNQENQKAKEKGVQTGTCGVKKRMRQFASVS